MAGYHKKVIYLSFMEYGERIKGAGFIKVEVSGNKWTFDMHVSGMTTLTDKRYDIYVFDENGEKYRVGDMFLHKGSGEWKKSGEGSVISEAGLDCGGIGKFVIPISDREVIEGRYESAGSIRAAEINGPAKELRKENKDKEGKNRETENRKAEAGRKEKLLQAAEKVSAHGEKANREMLGGQGKEIRMEEMILNDKWEQLCRMYPLVHPYEDERTYISIQPKDFVIMTGDYQHLANNSFLLHGFYNYRHIVLGREPSEETYGNFYLGVPGVYYEREKMVALMFGFEAFECCGGRAEPGKFGYYLRRVKI